MPISIFAYEDSYDLFVYQPAIIDQNIIFFFSLCTFWTFTAFFQLIKSHYW